MNKKKRNRDKYSTVQCKSIIMMVGREIEIEEKKCFSRPYLQRYIIAKRIFLKVDYFEYMATH